MRGRWITVSLLAAATAAGCSALLAAQGRDCPSIETLRAYRPPEASRVYAADSSLVADLSPQRRIVLELDEVPALLRDGFVAVEDRRFWQHGGVDLRGVVRAAWRDLTSLSLREGFSTITMQVVRNVFPEELPFSEKLRRKTCEVLLARRMEQEFSKPEILQLYLNQIYLGDGLYGVEAAARGYFDRPASKTAPEEAALLIALAKNPEGNNPRKHPLQAIRRRNLVLDVMVREGVLEAARAERAKARPIRLAPPPEAAGPAPYFVARVRRELRQRFGADADIRGLRVYTGLDPVVQRAAREALVAQLRRIEAGEYGRYRHPVPSDTGAGRDTAAAYLQGMIVALDPLTGDVRALVGGRDFALSQFDRAFQARRQPGSAFKPIVYAAALSQGLPITTRIETTPLVIDNTPGSPPWEPSDHLPDSLQTMSLRSALALSSNYAAVRIGRWVGEPRVVETAQALGITTSVPAYPSVHLGAADIIPAELVAAYAAFGNGGARVRPRVITGVDDARGRTIWRAPVVRQAALDEGVAFLTLSLLEDVVDRGTAAGVRGGGFWLPAAGKTGTSNEGKDAWFIGLTPDLVAGVWLGFDQPRPILPGASGGRLAVPVWTAFMKQAYADRPAPAAWVPPASVVSLPVDTVTGLLATGNCPTEAVRIEYFLPGTEPTEPCPLHPESGVERFFDRLWRSFRRVF